MLLPVVVASGPDDPSDACLLAAIAAGDEAALGRFYDRHAAGALGLACRMVGDRRTAEEVVQDTFVAVWRRASTFSPARGEPRSWLLGIVHHRAVDRLRGRAAAAATAELDLDAAVDLSDGVDGWREVDTLLTREAIGHGLARLPAEQRLAVELAFFGGLTHVEVAERLRLPIGTVKGRVRLALRRLRAILSEDPAGLAGFQPKPW